MISLFIFSQLLSAPEPKIFQSWLVEPKIPATTLELYQRFNLGGLLVDQKAFYAAGPDRLFEKRSLLSGESIWTQKLESDAEGSWTLQTGMLFGGDVKGFLYCLDAENGKIIWKVQTKGSLFAAPLIVGVNLYTLSSYGTLLAFDARNGQWLWQHQSDGTMGPTLWSAQGPVLFNNQIVAGFPNGTLAGFEPLTGKMLWNEAFSTFASEPLELNDVKAVTATADLLMASSLSGSLRVWRKVGPSKSLLFEKRFSLHTPAILWEEQKLILASGKDGTLRGLDIETGTERFQWRFPKGIGTTPQTSYDRIWIASSEGKVFVLSNEGKLLSESDAFQMPIYQPLQVLAKDTALVQTSRGIIRKLFFP